MNNQKYQLSPPNKLRTQTSEQIIQIVSNIVSSSDNRASTIHYLKNYKNRIPNLPSHLWYTPGVISSLLGEIISFYPSVSSGNIDESNTEKALDILSLFQCISKDPETKIPFIQANIPTYLLPFLYSNIPKKEIEYMKLASLGIFSDLLLDDSQEIIDYYIQIDLIPILLKILKYGTDVTQIVSAFILDKIISNAHGIESICSDIEKIASVVKVLSEVVVRLCKNFVPNLSKYIVNSFNALIEKDKAKPIIVSMWNNSFKDIQATEACSEEFINMLYTLKSGC